MKKPTDAEELLLRLDPLFQERAVDFYLAVEEFVRTEPEQAERLKKFADIWKGRDLQEPDVKSGSNLPLPQPEEIKTD